MMGRGKGHAGSPFGCRSIGPIAAHSKAGFMTGASFFFSGVLGRRCERRINVVVCILLFGLGSPKEDGLMSRLSMSCC
jgi:hypothetical protein